MTVAAEPMAYAERLWREWLDLAAGQGVDVPAARDPAFEETRARVWDLLPGGLPAARVADTTLPAGLVVLLSLAWTVAYLGIYRVPDNRLAAIQWLSDHARPGEVILLERDDAWSPDLLAALKDGGEYRVERYEPLAVMQDRPDGWDEDDVRTKQAYLQSRLSEADWLVLTDTNLSRMATLKQQFPVINDFYEGLGQKRTPFTQAASFAAGPSLLGFALEDSGAELSFRMADHPTVHLYRCTTPAPQTMPAARHKKAEPRR